MHLELLPHVATEASMGFRQELLDRLLHVTMEFLTAAKTDKGSERRTCSYSNTGFGGMNRR